MIILRRYKRYCCYYARSQYRDYASLLNHVVIGYRIYNLVDSLLIHDFTHGIINHSVRLSNLDNNYIGRKVYRINLLHARDSTVYSRQLYVIMETHDKIDIEKTRTLKMNQKDKPYIDKSLYCAFNIIIDKKLLAEHGIKLSPENWTYKF